MRKKSDSRWGVLYAVFAGLFVLVTAGYIGAVTYFTGLDTAVGWASAAFVILMLLLGGILVGTMKSEASATVMALNEMMDRAMGGQPRQTGYTESRVSSLEHKVMRYVELSNTHERKAEAEKSSIKALISDISHQTKTPLTNIVLYTDLLGETPGLDEEARQYIERIRDQSGKLDWLIRSLIKMSRLETGIIAIHTELASLIGTVSGAVSQIYAAAEQKGIEIRIDCDPGTMARHDAKWTAEALFNLLENAVKYSHSTGGVITITARANEMFTRIDIADTGIGIEEGEWNAVFKRFYRSPRTADYEGVGIGLYLTREILTAQGGYIKVSSVLGEGCVFSVFLPAL